MRARVGLLGLDTQNHVLTAVTAVAVAGVLVFLYRLYQVRTLVRRAIKQPGVVRLSSAHSHAAFPTVLSLPFLLALALLRRSHGDLSQGHT